MEWTWPISGKSSLFTCCWSDSEPQRNEGSIRNESKMLRKFVWDLNPRGDGRRRTKVSANNSLLVTENYCSTFAPWKITRENFSAESQFTCNEESRLWCPAVIFVVVTIPIWLVWYSNLLFRGTEGRSTCKTFTCTSQSVWSSPKTHTNPK